MNEPTIHDKEYSTIQKLDHFWTYYKWQTIVAVIVVGIVASTIVSVATKKEMVLQVMAFDTGYMYDTSMASDFESFAGIDNKHQEVIAQTNDILADDGNFYAATSSTKLMANISAKDLDVLMMDMKNYEPSIQDGCFLDLRTVFSEEELSKYPELVTDSMGNVWGIKTTSLNGLKKYGYYQSGENAAVGIVANSQKVNMAKQFILFLSEN